MQYIYLLTQNIWSHCSLTCQKRRNKQFSVESAEPNNVIQDDFVTNELQRISHQQAADE